MKRQKRTSGDILKIDLGDGTHSYAHVSTEPLIVFYEMQATDDMALQDIVKLPIAFRLWVFNKDIKSGVWPVVGNLRLSDALLVEPLTFKQDPINGKLSLHHRSFADTNYERPASLSECQGLERAAVWGAEHVEERLRDYYNGIENRSMKSMAIELDKVPLDQRR